MKNNTRVYNFSAGPSTLPLSVMEQAAEEMTNYRNCGMSVMEMSHRSKEFAEIIESAESNLRDLMNIPEDYQVLFLQGGGYLQFSMVPLNLLRNSKISDHIVTGSWAKKAAQEAEKFGTVNILASSEADGFSYIPTVDPKTHTKNADYLHITYNNTIYGTRFVTLPETGDVPLVADLSSMILSQELDIRRFGLAYAGAQKNIGPAGLTLVILRKDLIGYCPPTAPIMMDYKIHADAGSLFNTPPSFSIYVAGLTFRWIKEQGGVAAMQSANEHKASLLYAAIDDSDLFQCPARRENRSLMNVVFVTGSAELDKEFVRQAKEEGLVNLAGHRSTGGMRASIYNAMPLAGVEALIAFMKRFERENNQAKLDL